MDQLPWTIHSTSLRFIVLEMMMLSPLTSYEMGGAR